MLETITVQQVDVILLEVFTPEQVVAWWHNSWPCTCRQEHAILTVEQMFKYNPEAVLQMAKLDCEIQTTT